MQDGIDGLKLLGIVLWLGAVLIAVGVAFQAGPAWLAMALDEELEAGITIGGIEDPDDSELVGISIAGILLLAVAYGLARGGGWAWDYGTVEVIECPECLSPFEDLDAYERHWRDEHESQFPGDLPPDPPRRRERARG